MKNFIIHAGLPKTATTTFQDILFYNLHKKKIINYFGRISLGFKAEFNRISTDRLKYLIGITQQFPETYFSENLLNLYSEECLTDPPDWFFRKYGIKKSIQDLPQKLYHTFKDINSEIKIIITLRSHKTMVASFYTENYHLYREDEKTNAPDRYIKYVIENREDFNVWYFDKLLSIYGDVFGMENIYVLLYEDLIYEKDKALNEWAKILKVSKEEIRNNLSEKTVNVKQSVKGGKLKEIPQKTILGHIWSFIKNLTGINKIIENNKDQWNNNRIRKLLRPLTSKKKPEFVRDFTKEENENIFKHFRESNLRLVGKFGLNEERLKRHGYI